MLKNAPYWMALAHLPRWGYALINSLIVRFFHEKKMEIDEFFSLDEALWKSDFNLNEKQIADLLQAKSEIPGNSFLAESLYDQGYEIIPIISPEYPKILKDNLKLNYSPAVVYIKGNKEILKENSIAIVGSRDASEVALEFTDNIARLASKEYKVVVSGFAKGVDKQALDSAIACKGQSIIVLPQGIMTFESGFKTYYKQIAEGDVLVLSTFHPKAPWGAGLAMARNTIIYGLAHEIYVAESSDKGGTWSGVIDGLRKGRKIFVRKPENGEKNANQLLIQNGAKPVDFQGVVIENNITSKQELAFVFQEPEKFHDYALEEKIRKNLEIKACTAADLLNQLQLDWEVKKIEDLLKTLNFIEKVKNRGINVYMLKNDRKSTSQPSLFD